jgi:bacterioferritin-associated ferredoxin
MVVCHCLRVDEARIRASVVKGAGSVEDITEDCDAGGGCGRCWPTLQAMLGCSPSASEAAA